ncbi:transposase [Synoicihabitans lomoniglobus]|uniref:Transposase n=1 Tax=Synoicihabitans lomoniglobus TaxID=2909285 RepID=A0AAE9ZU96_9BACT|nr:transposase [Opitutaceae bacterium LMO-M01]WED64212.1 transposase [Opitutaceae bacterium LMO-M01]
MLRIQYPGAIYHVINRGNYRSDVFGSAGAAQAFVKTLEEAVAQYGWELGAYVVMRNHFHLAVRTPAGNLGEGMHWLQSTFATRFNRLRGERGHLFQGRYQAFVLQNEGVWARVADYIHLNPVRAGIVPVEHLHEFRWSSLARFLKNQRCKGLVADPWLTTLGMEDTPGGWESYVSHLRDRYLREDEGDCRAEHDALTTGWAVGADRWRAGLAEQHHSQVDAPGVEGQVVRDVKILHWRSVLAKLLSAAGKTTADVQSERKSVGWKIQLAWELRQRGAVPYAWIAEALQMGRPDAVRKYVSEYSKNTQNTA